MLLLHRCTLPLSSRQLGSGRNAAVAHCRRVMGTAIPVAFVINPASSCQIMLRQSSTFVKGCWFSITSETMCRQRTSLFHLQHPLTLTLSCPAVHHQESNSRSAVFDTSQIRHHSTQGGARRGSWRCPSMKTCRTIEEIATLATDHLEVMSPRDMAAFWAAVPRLLSARIKSSGKLQQPVVQQLEMVLVHSLEKTDKFWPRDLAQTTLGLAKIVQMIENQGGRHQNLHDLFIGINSEGKQFIFDGLIAASMHILSRFDARGLSNLIYALGVADYNVPKIEGGRSTSLFDDLSVEVIPKLDEFNPQGLSSMLWAYAKMEASNPKLFEEAGNGIASHSLMSFEPQALSNIVWAYATLGNSHSSLFKKVADHIVALDNLGSFNAQALSNIVFAYATLNESHPQLFEKVADHIVPLDDLKRFQAQSLSNIVWAYSTMNESNPKLFKKFADHIVALDNLSRFKAQNLSNIVWAYATAGESQPMLFKKVAGNIVALDNLDRFNPQNLSNTVWAYATADAVHPNLFEKVAAHIIALDNLARFKPQNLSNIVWAYATAKESSHDLFQKLSDDAIMKKNYFNSQNIANFLWACASNGEIDKNQFLSFVPSVKVNLGKCNSKELINIAWAYTVANVAAPSIFNNDFIDACLEKEGDLNLEDKCQLHQWQLWQDEFKSNIRLPQPLQKKCYEAFISRVPRPSRFQDDVISGLLSIGLQPEEEVLTKRGYRLDAIVEDNGRKVGIEVDGPTHFLGRKPTGNTILKRRQVTSLEGIQLVSVPYWEWDEVKNDSNKKQKYLQTLLGLS